MNILNHFQKIINNIANSINNNNNNNDQNLRNINNQIPQQNNNVIKSNNNTYGSNIEINNNIDNSKLFFKVFRNEYLKKLIFQQLKLIIKYENVLVYGLDEYNRHQFKDYIIGLSIDNYEIIQARLIPKSIRRISLSTKLDQNSIIKLLPSHINSINILPSFKCTAGSLPNNIKYLEFHKDYDKEVEDGFFHNNVVSVKIDSYLLTNFKLQLPDSITYLKIKYSGTLIPPLQLRELDGHFNKIDESKLIQLKYLQKVSYTPILIYGNNVNRPPNLPSSVKVLTLFSVSISSNSLPNSIEKLYLYHCGVEKQSIPSSVRTLVLKMCSEFALFYLPNGIRDLVYEPSTTSKIAPGLIPSSVISLKLGDSCFRSQNSFIHNSDEPILHEGLQILEFSSSFNSRFIKNSLPSTLTSLTLSYSYNIEFNENSLPPNLKYLKLGSNYNQKLTTKSLPPSLEYIEFGFSFDQELYNEKEEDTRNTQNDYGYLPSSNLKTLILGRSFNHKLPKKFSTSLTELHFGYSFKQSINEDSLNLKNLNLLKLPSNYDKSLLSSKLLNKLNN